MRFHVSLQLGLRLNAGTSSIFWPRDTTVVEEVVNANDGERIFCENMSKKKHLNALSADLARERELA